MIQRLEIDVSLYSYDITPERVSKEIEDKVDTVLRNCSNYKEENLINIQENQIDDTEYKIIVYYKGL